MPLGLDPDATVELWLDSDADKPIESRPVFLFRFLTCRKIRQVQDIRKRALESKDDAEFVKLVDEALLIGLAGWRNMNDIPFSPEAADDVLTPKEKWDLVCVYPSKITLTEADRKNSRSPSRLSAANSANASADQASAVPTNPPLPSPSEEVDPAPSATAT
jgi:hypothetical protein